MIFRLKSISAYEHSLIPVHAKFGMFCALNHLREKLSRCYILF